MNPKLILYSFSALMGCAAIGIAEAGATRSEERRRITVAAEATGNAARAAVTRAQQQLAAAEQARAQARSTFEELQRTPAGPANLTAARAAPPARANYKNPFAIVHDDPDVQALWFLSRRAALRATYGPLFRALQLAPDQIAQFIEIAIRREQQNLDLTATMWAQGLSKTDPALVEMEARIKTEYDSALTGLLGAAGGRQLREFESSLPVRKIATALAGVAAMRGVPLEPAQVEQLNRVLVELSGRNLTTDVSDPQTIDWDKVDAQAQTFLAPAQFALFQSVEPEDGYNLYMFRFGSRVAALTNRAKRMAAGLPEVSGPAREPASN